ncbi:MAG: hypothetical protein U0V70_01960 [Terriglobia bacterium]
MDSWKIARLGLMIASVLFLVLSPLNLCAADPTTPCHGLLATFPASVLQLDSLNGTFPRFELHRCAPGVVQVYGFEKGAIAPSLVFDTGDDYPLYLVHVENILVFQSGGGSSDHVFVFLFEKGKPKLALKTSTKGLIQVQKTRTKSGEMLFVKVPSTIYPGSEVKSDQASVRQYFFKVETP